MKKIKFLCLIVTVFAISYAVAQTPSLSYAQLKVNLTESLAGKSGSTDSCRMVFANKAQITCEKGDPNGGAKVSVRPGSQLDSLTQQLAEENMSEMSEQARISAENSISEFIEKNLAQIQVGTDTLNVVKSGKTSF